MTVPLRQGVESVCKGQRQTERRSAEQRKGVGLGEVEGPAQGRYISHRGVKFEKLWAGSHALSWSPALSCPRFMTGL